MHHFILPKGLYHQPGHMADNADLCDWAGTGQEKLCIVHDHFQYYLNSSMYEFLLSSYIDWCMNFCYMLSYCYRLCTYIISWHKIQGNEKISSLLRAEFAILGNFLGIRIYVKYILKMWVHNFSSKLGNQQYMQLQLARHPIQNWKDMHFQIWVILTNRFRFD
jgi:hypothetical protein